MKIKKRDLLISFKLHLADKIEHERTLISAIERHLRGVDEIMDGDIVSSIRDLCRKHNIDFDSVLKHALEMYNDKS